MACLDTCVLIDLMARRKGAEYDRALACIAKAVSEGDALYTSRFTLAELFLGVARAPDPAAEEQRVLTMLAPVGILDFDDRAARLFGSLGAALLKQGRPSGDMDLLIAAVAMAHGEPLITRNASHFELMPGLKLLAY